MVDRTHPSRSRAIATAQAFLSRPRAFTLATCIGLALAGLWGPGVAVAQEGTITYTHSVKLDLEFPPGVMTSSMRESIPKAMTSTKILHFTPGGSLMTEAENRSREDAARNRRGDRARVAVMSGDVPAGLVSRLMMMEMGMEKKVGSTISSRGVSAPSAVYEDYAEGTVVETHQFLGRTFRVNDKRRSFAWRIMPEQATHLGYPVMKATAEFDSTTVEAWFTTEIPVSGGPASFGGLPGMILVLSLDDGQTQYQATDITLQDIAEGLISEPDEGDEVSREEFDQIVSDKIDEIAKLGRSRGRGRGGEGAGAH